MHLTDLGHGVLLRVIELPKNHLGAKEVKSELEGSKLRTMIDEREAVIPLPLRFQPAFAEQLGYQGDRRFVAVYWQASGDELTLRDDVLATSGIRRSLAWTQYFQRPETKLWRAVFNINFGEGDSSATHWLIIDRVINYGFATIIYEAHKRIQQQRMRNLE